MKCFLCGERVQDVVIMTIKGQDFEICPKCVYGQNDVDEKDEIFVKQPIMAFSRPSYRRRQQRGGVR